MQDKLLKDKQKNTTTIFHKIPRILAASVFCVLMCSVGIGDMKLNIGLSFLISLIFYDRAYLAAVTMLIVGSVIYGDVISVSNSIISSAIIICTYLLFKKLSASGCGMLAFATNILSSFAVMKYFSLSDSYLLEGIISAVCGFVLCIVFTPCIVIFSSEEQKRLTSNERLCMVIFAALATVSLSSVQVPVLELSVLFAYALIMFFAKYFPAECMPYGFLVFVFSYTTMGVGYDYAICLFALSFFAFFSSKYPDYLIGVFSSLGVVAAGAMTGAYVGTYIPEILASIGVFCLMSLFFGEKIKTSVQIAKDEKSFMDESMDIVLSKEIALQKNALRSISSSIDLEDEETDGVKSVCRNCISQVCMECENYPHCWLEDGENTYEIFKRAVKTADGGEGGVSYFSDRCTVSQAEQLFESIKYYLLSMKSREDYKRKINRFLGIYKTQVNYLCDVMDRINSTIAKNLGFFDETSAEILSCLQASDIGATDVIINADFSGQLKAVIKSNHPFSETELKRDVRDVLRDKTKTDFAFNFSREPVGDEKYLYVYEQDYERSLKVSFACVVKEGEDRSGDSVLAESFGSTQLLAICDGMGSGRDASRQSEKVINMLSHLIAAGYEYKSAVEFINSVLTFGKNDEIFATLDMLIFDRKSSDAVFFKAGAESGFIRRGDEIIKIKSETLPIGILEFTHGKSVNIPLRKGDYVYLMSDGLISTFNYDEQALMAMIRTMNYRSTQRIADEIISVATAMTSGRAKDDISVIVCKVR